MSRPSEIYTKTISVRIPMESYLELLKTAVDHKMSISEFCTMKIFEIKPEFKDKQKKSTEKNEVKWNLKDTFSNKFEYAASEKRNKSFTTTEINALRKGKSIVSKDGKWKLVGVRHGLNQVWLKSE